MIKAVIFDIDGTLLDSVDIHAEAWQEALKKFGFDLPFEQVRSQIGKGGDQLIPALTPYTKDDPLGKKLDEYRADLFKRDYLPRVRALPMARELIERVLADGKKVALASSAKESELGEYKRIAGIDDLIDKETSSDDADRSKPHPDIFQAAIAKLDGIEPGEIVAVGDTPYDVEAAAKAGLSTIAVLSGGFPESELRREGCIGVYDGPADLLEWYDESPLKNR